MILVTRMRSLWWVSDGSYHYSGGEEEHLEAVSGAMTVQVSIKVGVCVGSSSAHDW